jgi:CubicO group peptidase (beta-lactamase class C family)
MKRILLLCCLLKALLAQSQTTYFPPLTGNAWDTLSPRSLGWCTNQVPALYNYLGATNTKAFIVLKNGRIVLERYFGTFTADSTWYWASAGKTLTAFTVGVAQQEGLLKLSDPVDKYLGKGWTSAPPAKEASITIRHQLTMTTGLRDGPPSNDCTQPSCLVYLADAGKLWAYHNAPYTLLDSVVEAASRQRFNTYVNSKISSRIGMRGLFVKVGYNNLYFSTARSMARFGLLLLHRGRWNNTPILTDTAYFRQMTTSSQAYNPSYGYLTWLNGKASMMTPGSQLVLPRALNQHAPPDMYAAMGKNGQLINVVPSQGLVVVRIGNAPDDGLVPFTYNEELWRYLNAIICPTVSTHEALEYTLSVYPNPATDVLHTQTDAAGAGPYILYSQYGQVVMQGQALPKTLDIKALPTGIYLLKMQKGRTVKVVKY